MAWVEDREPMTPQQETAQATAPVDAAMLDKSSPAPKSVTYSADHAAADTLDFFSDPTRLRYAAALAAQAGDADTMKWLARGHEAMKEGAARSLLALRQGDMQGALDTFNQYGNQRVVKIEQSAPGRYKLYDNKGQVREVDPNQELMTLLTPPQIMQHIRGEETTRVREELGRENIRVREELGQQIGSLRQQQLAERHAYDVGRLDDAREKLKLAGEAEASKKELRDAQAKLAGKRGDYLDARTTATQAGKPEAPMKEGEKIRLLNTIVDKSMPKEDIATDEGYSDAERATVRRNALTRMQKDKTLDPTSAFEAELQAHDQRRRSIEKRIDKEVTERKASDHWYIPGSPYGEAKNESQYRLRRRKELNEEGAAAAERAGKQADEEAAKLATEPPAEAVDYLRSNPALKKQFDKKYGPGAADKALGAKRGTL